MNKREKLLRSISAAQFALWELHLYLNTHPADMEALSLHEQYEMKLMKLKASKEEKKTIGILLCRNKNDSLVKMTLPEDNKTILAAEYKLRLPSEEQLLAEVKRAEEEFEAAKDEADARERIRGGAK